MEFPPRALLTQGLPDSLEVCGISDDGYQARLTPASLPLQLCFLQLKKAGEAVLRVTLWSTADFLFWDKKNMRKWEKKKEKYIRKEKDGYSRVSHSQLSDEWGCFPSCYSQWTKLHHANWPLPCFVKQVPGLWEDLVELLLKGSTELLRSHQRKSIFSHFMASESKHGVMQLKLH